MKRVLITMFVIVISLCMIDITIFVYASLSQYFLITLFSFISLIIVYIYALSNRLNINISKTTVILFLWTLYILLNTFLILNGEHYRTYLMISYLCLFLLFCTSIELKILTRNGLMYILLSLGIVQSISCILQSIEFISSPSKYFSITGLLENPNVTAMYIAAVLPFGVFHILPKNKKWGILSIYILLIGIVLLECRTAYIGVLITGIIYFIQNDKIKKRLSSISLKYRIIFSVLTLTAILLAGNFLYYHKKNSADGRIFIWKLSAQMIASKPLNGYGYGTFERNYNLYQADYFESGKGSDVEKVNANHVFMAYNEYIEQCVDGGIICLAFYLFLMGYSIWCAVKQKDWEAVSVTAVFAFMGCSNFIVQAIPVWLVFLIYIASISVREKALSVKRSLSRFFAICMIFICIGLFLNQSKLLKTQFNLKQALALSKVNKHKQALQLLEQYAGDAETSEAFLRNYGKALMFNGKIPKAMAVLEKASCYTSSTNVYYSLANCYIQSKQYEKAETALNIVANMIPLNLKSRYQLMQLYSNSNQHQKAIEKAKEIININPKVTTKEGLFYKDAAKKFLDREN